MLHHSTQKANRAPRSDFLRLRREAALTRLKAQHPQPTPERDTLLLRILGRETRTGEEMEAYRDLLFSQDSECSETMGRFNTKGEYHHPRDGMTFDELQGYLDRCEPVYEKLAELSSPLPQQTFFRNSARRHAEKESADGKFDYHELFAPGFHNYATAFYVSDGTDSIDRFGEATQTVELAENVHYLDLWDSEVHEEVHGILAEHGLQGDHGVFDLLYKSGIEVTRYRPSTRGESWYNIYNPESVESVSLGAENAEAFPKQPSTETVEPKLLFAGSKKFRSKLVS